MQIICVKKGEEIIVPEVEAAFHFFSRFRGLMFRKSMPRNHGLMLRPCNQVHTFAMKFPMDAVYIDAEGKVIHIDASMPPRSVGKTVKGAKCILELCGGAADELGIKQGDFLTF